MEAETYQALSSKSRLDILRLLYRKPMNIGEISQRLGLQPITVRHHVQYLIRAGFIQTAEEKANTVGRPRISYRIIREPRLVNYPKRGYLILSSHLINTLRSALKERQAKDILRKVGLEMGESTTKRLESGHEIENWSMKTYERVYVKEYLEQMGAEPEIVETTDKKITYRLHNCLFFELSVKMPEIMCDVLHESFHEGLVRVMDKQMKVTRASCLSRGDPYCEHSCALLE